MPGDRSAAVLLLKQGVAPQHRLLDLVEPETRQIRVDLEVVGGPLQERLGNLARIPVRRRLVDLVETTRHLVRRVHLDLGLDGPLPRHHETPPARTPGSIADSTRDRSSDDDTGTGAGSVPRITTPR